MRAQSYIGAEKITFPPKPDRQTDIHTDRWMDISVNRVVASLLKISEGRGLVLEIEMSEKITLLFIILNLFFVALSMEINCLCLQYNIP